MSFNCCTLPLCHFYSWVYWCHCTIIEKNGYIIISKCKIHYLLMNNWISKLFIQNNLRFGRYLYEPSIPQFESDFWTSHVQITRSLGCFLELGYESINNMMYKIMINVGLKVKYIGILYNMYQNLLFKVMWNVSTWALDK